MSMNWGWRRSLYILALSAAAVIAGRTGQGMAGDAPRTAVVQAPSSAVSGSCAPPCRIEVSHPSRPSLRARQGVGAQPVAPVGTAAPTAPAVTVKQPAAPAIAAPVAAPPRTPPPVAPRPRVIAQKAILIDGRPYRVVRTIDMIATAYGDSQPGIGTRTASGTRVHVGEVAVDPRVVPLGTWLFIDGYHAADLPPDGLLAHAEDTGGAIIGDRVDIYLNGPLSAYMQFGRQTVNVEVLAPEP